MDVSHDALAAFEVFDAEVERVRDFLHGKRYAFDAAQGGHQCRAGFGGKQRMHRLIDGNAQRADVRGDFFEALGMIDRERIKVAHDDEAGGFEELEPGENFRSCVQPII